MTDQHTTVQYQLRLSEELREKIKQVADSNKRSMNAEIVARLETTLDQDELHAGGFTRFIDEYLDLMADNADLKAENDRLKAGFPPPPVVQKTVSQENMDYLYERLKTLIENKHNS